MDFSMKWIESHSVMSNSLWPHGLYSPWNSPGLNTGMSSLSLLQGIFPTQETNPGLLHCRQILYQLSHKGSQILAWAWIIQCFFFSLPMQRQLLVTLITWNTSKGSLLENWMFFYFGPRIFLFSIGFYTSVSSSVKWGSWLYRCH